MKYDKKFFQNLRSLAQTSQDWPPLSLIDFLTAVEGKGVRIVYDEGSYIAGIEAKVREVVGFGALSLEQRLGIAQINIAVIQSLEIVG